MASALRRFFSAPLNGDGSTSHSTSSARTSLSTLPADVLAYVADLLRCTSLTSLANLSLVNRQLHSLAQYSQHHTITLDLCDSGSRKSLKRCQLIESAALEHAVREVAILQSHSMQQLQETEYQEQFDALLRLLPTLTGLKTIKHLDFVIPTSILAILPPGVLIHTKYSSCFNPEEESIQDEAVRGLYGNPNLYSLDIQIEWTHEPECQRMMHLLKKLLITCSGLRRLNLYVSQPTSGCVLYSVATEYVGFGFEDGESLPLLEELDLIKYPFEVVHGGGTKDEAQYWAEKFDWSKLKRLKTGHGDFALKAAKHFSALEEIHFTEDWENHNVAVFLNLVPSRLRSITASNIRNTSLEGVLLHSSSLESLHLHQAEDHQGTWRSSCLDIDTVDQLKFQCPNIKNLTLDVARSGSWPYSMFDALAACPNLQTLDIWFEMGVADFQHPVEPVLTFDSARHISEYLYARCKSLRKVHLYSGDGPSIGHGYPASEAFWPMYNSTSFICELSERADETVHGKSTVRCPTLERAEINLRKREEYDASHPKPFRTRTRTQLRKTFQPDRYRRRKAAEDHFTGTGQARLRRDEAFVVAHEGPIPVSMWDSHY